MKYDLTISGSHPQSTIYMRVGVLKLLYYIWKYESSEYELNYKRRIKWNYH